MRYCFLCCLVLVGLFARSQSDSILRLVKTYPISSGELWNVDVLGNLYRLHKEKIVKMDSTGSIKFQQSVKSFGDITALYPINTMKLALFSEQQQLICFLDNTLTPGDACLDLNQFQLDNVTLASISVQPDKLWLYEGLNGRLVKVSLSQMSQLDQQKQEMVNLNSLIGSDAIVRMKEVENILCLYSESKQLFLLDRFGSLLSKYDGIPNGFDVQGDFLLYVEDESLILQSLTKNQRFRASVLGLGSITEIRFSGKYIYVQDVDKISKYELLLAN